MPVTLEQGDIFGRIGKALGEGVGTGVSEQYGRNQIANALQTKEGEKFNALQKTSDLARAGASPQEISQYLPLIRQQMANQSYLEGQESQPTNTQPNAKAPIQEEQKSSGTSKSQLVSPEEIKKFQSKQLQPINDQDIDRLGRQLMAQGQVFDIDEARKVAKARLQTNLSAQEEKVKNVTNDINERMALGLQSSGIGNYKDLSGEIQKRLLEEGKYDVFEKGKTTEETGNKIGDIISNLGKAITQTKKVGTDAGYMPFSGKNEKTRSTDLRAARKEFEKYGFEELYDDEAAAIAGITPMKAASILDPVNNKKLLKEIKGKGKESLIHGFYTRLGDRDLNKIADAIGKYDNILSIEHELRDRRININDFREKLLEPQIYEKLTEKQQRQLNKPAVNSIFDDLLFSTL